ncbi:hypothetical protein CTAYLR_004198 [Chrysophaeum taylorii]|uniref:K Homology domain-containing protein n=1 Tax=Chrysophaeum taylorii TaxID=2483200 RepID=A0AAD7UHV5_9STRA|nr:hypothetical protein CTAYLR_004198 [Chrysophaeum taylorii]
MDDGVISGSPREVVDALLQYARDIQASGEELRLDKCVAFCPALGMGLLDHPDVHDHVQVAPDGTRTLAGIPVVADGLVIYATSLQREVDAQVSYMSRIRTKLQNVSLHCMYSLGRYCIAPRMDYIAQHCYPTNALSALRRFDVAALSFVATALGADPRQVFDSTGIVLQRLRLPARSGGGGIRSCADLSPAAFVGTAAQALPHLVDLRDPTGAVEVPGYLPRLASVLGATSFRTGNELHRWHHLLASGCRLGRALETAWDGLRADLRTTLASHGGAASGDPANGHLVDGPLSHEFVSMGVLVDPTISTPVLIPQLQRALTSQRETARATALQRLAATLTITDALRVDKDDAAFILGRGGSTKRKISRVAGADIELDEVQLTITMTGTAKQCDRAADYVDFVKQQRVGPVTISLDSRRDDFTAYRVPEDCIGFVMGRNGQTLRSMEEEWGVLMFFAKTKLAGRSDATESLCIFGPLHARRGAEIKVMSAVEHKHPGFCVSSRNELRELERVPGDEDAEGWGTDTVLLSEENYSYALGSKGSTRKKLATASGCILEYVGRLACVCGYKRERRRGKDYLRWLLEQRTGQSSVQNPRDRDDCLVLKIPSQSIAFITGHRGESLRDIERESGTFCFTDGDRADRKDTENLLIFSFSRRERTFDDVGMVWCPVPAVLTPRPKPPQNPPRTDL